MPPKTASGSWKTGEQLEFLLSHWERFKRAQDAKAVDHFWPKVLDDWYTRWPVPKSPSLARDYGTVEEGRVMLQKERTLQIKQWYNNRCRAGGSAGGSRGDLKLDVAEKRKLAALQAYCSYAWASTLQPIVLTRWEQQKKTATFGDNEDPSEEDDVPPEEATIPLAFKIKIAKEVFAKLSGEEKKEIDRRREEDREKLYRKIAEIDDDDERHAKLRIHLRNQPLVAKSLTRVLTNLEDQTGCVAQLLIASVNPSGGAPSIQKFCQGSTQHGVKFEAFYGQEWQENVEAKFREWAIRIFGEKGTERRNTFLLPEDSAAPSEASSSGSQSKPEASSSQNTSAEASSSQNKSAEATPSKKVTSRPSRSQKSVSQKSASQKSVSQPSVAHDPSPTPTSTSQAAATSNLPQRASTVVSNLPTPVASTNSRADTPSLDSDTTLLPTAAGVRQPPSQVGPITITSGNPDAVEPSQLVINPSQVVVEPSQVVAEPSQVVVEPSQVVVGPSRPVPKPSKVSTEVVPMDTQPDSTVPSQPLAKVPYRVRNPTTTPSGRPSRRDSIDGAPEMIIDVIDDEQELTVDLREYIDLESDSDESHVSSSQKTADECRELPPSHPNSQQQCTSVGRMKGTTSQPEFISGRTIPQLNVDEGDLPVWMTKKNQWRYVASTAGGTAWENLLKVYMNQERRLEFMEMGGTLTNDGRPSKVKEYFQYAHQPSRGDTLTVPDFGAEVAEWWERIQPEWRRSKQDLPESPSQWSYILSGGSKGAFLVILCLAWWDRAYERHLEKQKKARRVGDLPNHDAEWLNVVNDVAFVMQKARDSSVLTRGMSIPSRGGKRKRQEDPAPSEQVPAAKRSSRRKSKA